MSRYDSRTTIFSPEGRLFQVEYALEAINKTPPAVGIVCSDGIILLAEKRTTSALVERMTETEKLHQIDQNTVCAVTGLTADSNQLLSQARQYAQKHLYTYRTYPSIESTVLEICNLKQSYTQFGGLRPFGVAFLIAGWDKQHGFQLYSTDPAGNYASWSIKVIGQGSGQATRKVKEICVQANKELKEKAEKANADDNNNGAATTTTTTTTTTTPPKSTSSKQDESYVMKSIAETLPLAGRILAHSLSVDSIKSENIEGAVLRLDANTKKIVYHVLKQDELADVVKKTNALLENVNKADE